jgi:hypothetical protein
VCARYPWNLFHLPKDFISPWSRRGQFAPGQVQVGRDCGRETILSDELAVGATCTCSTCTTYLKPDLGDEHRFVVFLGELAEFLDARRPRLPLRRDARVGRAALAPICIVSCREGRGLANSSLHPAGPSTTGEQIPPPHR